MSAIGSVIVMSTPLPARLGHAGQLTGMGELAHADTAQAELAEHRPGPATTLAAPVGPHLELRCALGLDDQRLLCHVVLVTSSAPPVHDHRAWREPPVDLF